MAYCSFIYCRNKAKYGVKQLKESRCKEHKETGMVIAPKCYCKHDRRRNQCKECGGSQMCEHKRIRSRCKECGGSQMCEHNRRQNTCKECGGSQICEHNRRRNTCKECGGSQICEHKRIRNTCKECGGSQICEHDRQRYQCKECGYKPTYNRRKRKRFHNEYNSGNRKIEKDESTMVVENIYFG